MNRKELHAEIDRIDERLRQNSELMGLRGRRDLEQSPAIQSNLRWILGGAFAGGLVLGLVNRKVGLLAMLPYALRL